MKKFKLPGVPNWGRRSYHLGGHIALPRVITFWSLKAAGKTTLAAALALAMAGSGKSVACADLDVLTHDLPGGGHGLDQVSEDILRGDFDPAKSTIRLTRLKPAQVYLLAGLADPVRADSLEQSEISELVAAMAASYDLVVLDTCRVLALEATLAALDSADLILVPMAPAENQSRHLGRYLTLLEQGLRLDKQKIRVVVNHVPGGATLPVAAIEQVLGRPVAGEVPFYRNWTDWAGDNLPPVDGREELLLGLASLSAPGLGERGSR